MKKIFLWSLAVFFTSVFHLSAQVNAGDSVSNREKVRLGIKLGGQISAIGNIHYGSGKRIPGLTAGVVMQIPLQRKDSCRWFFSPEIVYSQEGEKGYEWGKNDEKKFYHDYLSFPLMFKFYPGKNKSLYIESGPRLSYAIYQKNKDIDWAIPGKFDIGLSLGGGLNIGRQRRVELGMRCNLGLIDMYPDVKRKNYNIGGVVTFTYFFNK